MIFFLLLTFPLSAQSKETGVLYGWKTFQELQWMSFGIGKLQPKYIGEINNGEPDGLGILYFPSTDGEKVVGTWKEGKQWNTKHHNKDGEVIGKYVNGEIKLGVLFHRKVNRKLEWYEYGDDQKYVKYSGEIENGKPNGQGIFTYSETDKYEGEWKDGEFHGQGTLYNFYRTDKYEKIVGEFREGKEWNTKHYDEDQIITQEVVNGINFKVKIFGEKVWDKNGFLDNHNWRMELVDSYRLLGIRMGEGSSEFTWSEKLRYIGEYKEGKPNGQGALIFHDGSKWEGQWIDGKEWNTNHYDKDGNIIIKYVNGVIVFEKEHEDKFQKRGFGSYKSVTYRDTKKYVGDWKNGKYHGQGTLTWDEKEYEGEWKDGKRHGQGTLTYTSFYSRYKKYVGAWKDGKKHGQGTFTYSDGGENVGEFREDESWNTTKYDKEGNIIEKFVNGERKKLIPKTDL